jgi:ATP-dependent helicase/nuclease subunit B
MAAPDTRPARVFSIPPGWPFVDSLAAGLWQQAGERAEVLAAMTVLLPTRRAARALREAFLRLSAGRAMMLPRMMPLGDMDDDELVIEGDAFSGGPGDDILLQKPAISGLKRQLMLARLVMARPDHPESPEQAMFLAAELARLLDQVHTERLDFKALAGLVPDDYARHWQVTLDFLTLVSELWPGILDEAGAVDAATRRNALLEARTHAWTKAPPQAPVIAAGSTGSIPATADLLAVIARLPQGAVVLPGLDRDAPDAVWSNLTPAHPQYGMAQLIRHLGVARADVADWPAVPAHVTSPARARLINVALAPADAADAGTLDPESADAALAGITRLDCPGPAEEADAVALMMRRALETPGRTAALVTPDRGLARRVAAALRRWNVEIDDSAGRPLTETPPGAFLRLVVAAVAEGLRPVTLLALLKHPLAGLGRARAECRRLARQLEIAVLRGPAPAPSVDGLRQALAGATTEGKAPAPELPKFLDDLEHALAPLASAFKAGGSLADLVRAHTKSAECLAATDDESGADALWRGDAGEQAAALVAELTEAAGAFAGVGAFVPTDYAQLFEAAMIGRVVRPSFGTHPRLFIWGLLEARLQRADLTILGGLNEGTWPPEAVASPWMSRPMMAAFGLPQPERRLGLTAHDFVQGLGAGEVVLTRAERVGGTPTVPSRWLRRLDNLLERIGRKQALASEEPWLGWAAALDRPEGPRTVSAPRPTPPVAARPRRLSVTRIETLVRDPYSIYASHILRLLPLDPLDADPGAAERGTIVHRALDDFVRAYPDDLPEDALPRLIEFGRKAFAGNLARPGVRALWWPRFRRIAEWFIANERYRREQGFRTAATEVRGAMTIEGRAGAFEITARADRIDYRADVGYAVIDYKTGTPPSNKQVEMGWNPQLPLEAAMLAKGGFATVEAGPTAHLLYMRLSGGRVPGEEKPVKLDVEAAVAGAVEGVTKLVHRFDGEATPYLSQPRPQFLNLYGEYDHLARVKEWRGGRRR